MKRRTWRSLSWDVERTKRVERYKYVHVKSKRRVARSKKCRGRGKWGKAMRSAKRSVRRDACRRRKRVKRARPIYWTEYSASARLGALRFYVSRFFHGEPYVATASLDGVMGNLAQGEGDSPAKAFNAMLDEVESELKRLKRDTTKLLKLLYD